MWLKSVADDKIRGSWKKLGIKNYPARTIVCDESMMV